MANETHHLELTDYVQRLTSHSEYKLLVEGVNTLDISKAISSSLGRDYEKELATRKGDRCVYILELTDWPEDKEGKKSISSVVKDLLIFSKEELSNALQKAKTDASGYKIKGERIRCDGYLEGGTTCYKYTHLRDIEIELKPESSNPKPTFDIIHNSTIPPCKKPVEYT